MSILHVRHCLNFSAFIDFSIPHCNIEVKWSESHSVVSDSLWSHGLYCPWHSPGQNTGVGSLSLLQRIFPTQGLNPGLLHCRQILYQLSHKGSPRTLKWVAYPFSRRSSWPRNQTGVSCIAGGFFTNWAIREAPSSQTRDQIHVPCIKGQILIYWITREVPGPCILPGNAPGNPPSVRVPQNLKEM